MQDASTQAQQSLQRKAWSGGGASCWDSSLSPSCWMTSPSSSHSHSVISKIHWITRNYIYKFTGYPGIAGAVVPVIFRGTRTSFGLLLRGSPKIYYLFRAPDGLYFPASDCANRAPLNRRAIAVRFLGGVHFILQNIFSWGGWWVCGSLLQFSANEVKLRSLTATDSLNAIIMSLNVYHPVRIVHVCK